MAESYQDPDVVAAQSDERTSFSFLFPAILRHYGLWIHLIVLCALVLRFISIVQNPFLGSWDEVVHAVVAGNLSDHYLKPTLYDDPVIPFDKFSWYSNHVWLHKPPLMLWLMGFSIDVFGRHAWAVRLPSAILSSLSLYLVYAIVVRLFTIPLALFVTVLLAFNSFHLSLINGKIPTDHIDIGLFFFSLLAMYFFINSLENGKIRGWYGVAIGLAFLTKSIAGALPLMMVPLYFWRFGLKRTLQFLTVTVISFLVIAAPWNIYAAWTWPDLYQYESSYSMRHIFEGLEGHNEPWYYFFSSQVLQDYYCEGGPFFLLFYVAIGFLFSSLWRSTDRWRLTFLLIWLLTPILLYSISATRLISYCIITIPAGMTAICLFIAASSRFCFDKMKNSTSRMTKIVLVIAILLVWGFPLRVVTWELNRQLTGSYQQCSSDLKYYDNKDFLKKTSRLESMDGRKVIFNVRQPYHHFLMFRTSSSVYTILPGIDELEEYAKRYQVIVINPPPDFAVGHETIIRMTIETQSQD